MTADRTIQVASGPGCFTVRDWRELWAFMWRAVAFSIHFKAFGKCTCGCAVFPCDYCAYECSDNIREHPLHSS